MDAGTDLTDAGEVFSDWTGYLGFGALAGSALLVGYQVAKMINRRGSSILGVGGGADAWEGW